MNTHNKVLMPLGTLVILALFGVAGEVSAATAPNFGAATGYSVFGNAGVTDAGGSTMWGDVGENGAGDGTATGAAGTLHTIAQPVVVGAISAAYGALAQPLTGAIDLATSPTVVPGVYDIAATAFNSPLTLDGAGVYIFRGSASIAQTAGGTMLLTNGACASDVFWEIPTSMTFAAPGNIEGTIITNTGLISFVSGVSLKGRAFAATQVTMDNNQITEPTPCVVPPPPPATTTPSSGSSSGSSSPRPRIHVEKVATPDELPNGAGTVVYDYAVTNVGTISINDIEVTDDKCDDVEFVGGDADDDDRLDRDEEWTYQCSMRLSETTTNIVTATGESQSGRKTEDTDEATVEVTKPVVSQPLVQSVVTTPRLPDTGVAPRSDNSVMFVLISLALLGTLTLLRPRRK